MSITSNFKIRCSMAAIMAFGLMVPASAAVLNVPSGSYANLDQAISAAQDGDEIRVANDFNETNGWLELENKSITITSYTPDFTTPATGAQWNTPVDGWRNDALLTLRNASLTITGFRIETIGGNAFYLDSNSSLTMNDCEAYGISTGDTAVIKAGPTAQQEGDPPLPAVSNVNVTLNNCILNDNGRAIWFNSVSGNTSLTINNSEFANNISYPIEWRVRAGNHTFDVEDSRFVIINNRQVRALAFNTPSGQLTTAHASFDRCYFVSGTAEGRVPGRSPLKVGGVPLTADPNSEMTVNVTNSVFDLREGLDNVETVALDTQDDTDARRFTSRFDHCTIVFGGEDQCGFRLREHNSTITVTNSIVDGNGAGRTALRGWRGTIISNANLLNAATATETATGGTVTLTGNEIIDQPAEFVDRDGGDFHLQATSPALNAGVDAGILEDIEGNPRPQPAGSNPDLGAYEHAEVASVGGWMLY